MKGKTLVTIVEFLHLMKCVLTLDISKHADELR